MVTHADYSFLQMFLWKKFPSLALKPVEIHVIIIEIMIHIDGTKLSKYDGSDKPKAWRWLNAKRRADKSFIKIINNMKKFNFHPYTYNEA